MLDSVLARIGTTDGALPPGRQGVERRIPIHMLERLALTADLMAALELSPRRAFSLAQALTPEEATREREAGAHGTTAVAAVGPFAWLEVDRESLRREIEERLTVAIESVVRPRRGRPPRR